MINRCSLVSCYLKHLTYCQTHFLVNRDKQRYILLKRAVVQRIINLPSALKTMEVISKQNTIHHQT